MTHSLLSRSVISLIALAPLALVSTASASFINRHATSGVMSMSGYYNWLHDEGSYPHIWTGFDEAYGTIPPEWENGSIGWRVQASNVHTHPRLIGNAWQDTGVSIWSRPAYLCQESEPNASGETWWYEERQSITWSVPNLEMIFAVDVDDYLEIRTQTFGSFSANFEQQNIIGQWIPMGTWSNLGEINVFNVVVGTNYRFQLTGSDVTAWNPDSILEMHLTGAPAPAPGALALLGMAGIFGGRRRR